MDAHRLTDAPALIDATTPERVLAIGSLPPEGRDLDLLVRPRAQAALAEALRDGGFHASGRTWVRFRACDADVVELIPAATLGLDPAQLDRLFEEAEPLDGSRLLRRPSPHHRLLLLARRVAAEARLEPKRRAAAEEADEGAWALARELAPAWGAGRALRQLRGALEGRAPQSWHLRLALLRARRYRPGALIAISGLDGSGKSTQAEGVARALSKIGYSTSIVWTSLGGNPSLKRIAAPVRALLGHRGTRQAGVEWPPAGEDDDPLTRLRERRPWMGLAWLSLVATMNAWGQARAVRPRLLRGRIVVCDRYTLDSIVNLRYRYGAKRRYRLQLALIGLLSPAPLRAYLLEVSPATARARNREYTLGQIELRASLYREEHARLGVIPLDGERPAEELCAHVALEVWRALEGERPVPPLARARRFGRRPSDP